MQGLVSGGYASNRGCFLGLGGLQVPRCHHHGCTHPNVLGIHGGHEAWGDEQE